jgi:hypothetical protein
MGGFELLLLGLLPLALLAAVTDGDTATADEGATEPEAEAAPDADAPADLLAAAPDGVPPATETAEGGTRPATASGPVSALWPEAEWPAPGWPEADWPEEEAPAELSRQDPAAPVTGSAAGIVPADLSPRGSDGAGPDGAGPEGTAGDLPAQDWAAEDWAAEDWPEFAQDPASGAGEVLRGTRGADTLVAGDGGARLWANWTPDLAVAQGSDLFAWRDDGAADSLTGGAGDDRLVLAHGDSASGGGGANLFEVWSDPASPLPPARLEDFTPGTDRLDIVVKIDEAEHPDCGAWDWDRDTRAALFPAARVEILRDPAADLTEIRIDGQPAAHLAGAPEVTRADLRILAFWDVHS